jgi:hypothetical protein
MRLHESKFNIQPHTTDAIWVKYEDNSDRNTNVQCYGTIRLRNLRYWPHLRCDADDPGILNLTQPRHHKITKNPWQDRPLPDGGPSSFTCLLARLRPDQPAGCCPELQSCITHADWNQAQFPQGILLTDLFSMPHWHLLRYYRLSFSITYFSHSDVTTAVLTLTQRTVDTCSF